VDSFDALVFTAKELSLHAQPTRSNSTGFKSPSVSPSGIRSGFASGHTDAGHCAEKFHFRLIFRSRAIFRFIAADPLPVPVFLAEDFFRRRGVDAFVFFFARRRVPPPVDDIRPN